MNDIKRRQGEIDRFSRRVEDCRAAMNRAIEAYVTAQQTLVLAHDKLERAMDVGCCNYHASGAPESKSCGDDIYIGHISEKQ